MELNLDEMEKICAAAVYADWLKDPLFASVSHDTWIYLRTFDPPTVKKMLAVIRIFKNIGPHYGQIPWPALEEALKVLEVGDG